MSKSRKRQSSGTSAKTPAPAPTEKSALHQPIKPTAAQKSPLRARIDSAFPAFSLKRYLAIWVAGMVPLIGLLFILLHPWDERPVGTKATQTVTATSTVSGTVGTGSLTATAILPATKTPDITVTLSLSATAASVARPPVEGVNVANVSRFLVIETAKGRIVARLNTSPGTSPGANLLRTVANFSERTNSGVLDGSTFFRVETWFVQGGGDPDAAARLPAEYNKIPFTAGSVALAHGVDSAFNSDSQFLIAKTDAPQLDEQYTNLGQVVEGMNVVNRIAPGDKMMKVRVVSGSY